MPYATSCAVLSAPTSVRSSPNEPVRTLLTLQSATEKLLLTPTEAASALGIGRSKLYELMRTGAFSSVRIGGCRRVPAAGLSDLVAQLDRGGDG